MSIKAFILSMVVVACFAKAALPLKKLSSKGHFEKFLASKRHNLAMEAKAMKIAHKNPAAIATAVLSNDKAIDFLVDRLQNSASVQISDQLNNAVASTVGGVISAAFGAGCDFKDKKRPLILTVVNNLNVGAKLARWDFDSGKAYSHPPLGTVLEPGHAHIFYLSEKDGSFMTGVSGWMEYQRFDSWRTGCIGFAHPWYGSVKCQGNWTEWGPWCWDHMQNTMNHGVSRVDLSGIPQVMIFLRDM